MYCSKCGKQINQGENFCANCGTAVNAKQVTQSNGNYNPQYSRNANQASSVPNYSNAPFIIGVILLIAGILGAFGAGATIAVNFSNYNYSLNHLSSDKTQMIMILIVSVIGGFIGLIMTIVNHKN